jgi:uncharacterized Zn finger protein
MNCPRCGAEDEVELLAWTVLALPICDAEDEAVAVMRCGVCGTISPADPLPVMV